MKLPISSQILVSLLLGCLLTLAFTPASQAESLRQLLLMPGKLNDNHQQYEDTCENCHSDFERSNQKALCLGCHEVIKENVDQNRGFHGLNPVISVAECKQCHTDHQGRDFDIVGLDKDTFDHRLTNFKLVGKHRNLACDNCHRRQDNSHNYRQEQYQCQNCHAEKSPHGEVNPFGQKFGGDCGDCHESRGWQHIKFDHEQTEFPLKDSHSDTACQNCHINDQYEGTDGQCSSCHAIDDAHQQRFGQNCASCHVEKQWQQPIFRHDHDTEFKLQFRHRDISCESCHTKPVDTQLPDTKCAGCHRKDDIHNGNHGDKCDSCHSPEQWSATRFDHDSETDFALTGEHRDAACNGCHNQLQNNEVPGRQCIDCHRLADPHSQSLGKDCALCHQTSGWAKNLFSHELIDFPLIGIHRQLSCEECHIDANYAEMEGSCHHCHQDLDHHDGALGQKCEICHTPNDWSMWMFDHNKQTDHELTGAHSGLQCDLCHNNESSLSRKCGSCHRDDDIHRGSFGQNCQYCHDEESFSR